MVGEGAEEPGLRVHAASLGISDRIHFLGFRRDLAALIDEATVAVQPSLQEGFPNSVIEFMAVGRPLIASQLAGIPEAVEHEEHGLLVPAGEPAALAAALQRLLADPEYARRLGSAARRRAVEEFSEPTMIDRVESVLDSVLRSRS